MQASHCGQCVLEVRRAALFATRGRSRAVSRAFRISMQADPVGWPLVDYRPR